MPVSVICFSPSLRDFLFLTCVQERASRSDRRFSPSLRDFLFLTWSAWRVHDVSPRWRRFSPSLRDFLFLTRDRCPSGPRCCRGFSPSLRDFLFLTRVNRSTRFHHGRFSPSLRDFLFLTSCRMHRGLSQGSKFQSLIEGFFISYFESEGTVQAVWDQVSVPH